MKSSKPAVFEDENSDYTNLMRYANSFISTALSQAFNKFLSKQSKFVLDAGCGSGEVTLMIAEHLDDFEEIIAIDISKPHIKASQDLLKDSQFKEKNIQFIVEDISNLNYPQNTFDVIWTSNALTHVTDMKKTVTGFKKILKPGGNILAFQAEVVNHLFLPWNRDIEIRMEEAFWRLNKNLYPKKSFYYFTDMKSPFLNHDFKKIDIDCFTVVKQAPLSDIDKKFVKMFFKERYMNKQIVSLYSKEDWEIIKKAYLEPFYEREDFFTIFVLTICCVQK